MPQRLFAPQHGLSQLITSFIAIVSQGIRQLLLITYKAYFSTNQGSHSIIEVLVGCLLGISPHLAGDNLIPRSLQDLVTLKWLNINTSNVYCFVFCLSFFSCCDQLPCLQSNGLSRVAFHPTLYWILTKTVGKIITFQKEHQHASLLTSPSLIENIASARQAWP